MKSINFSQYWTLAKKMSFQERKSFFSSLPKKQQKVIKDSYFNGGWQDVFIKNKIDELCDLVKSTYQIDIYDIKINVILKKKNVLVSKRTWEDILDLFYDYDTCFNLNLLFGGIGCRILESNPDYCELYKAGEIVAG